jgi:hypothetical protein
MANLTGSWLAFRLGVDPGRIESMRKAGELYAVRDESRGEWHYPSWQFDLAGQTKPAVREMLRAPRAERRSPGELIEQKIGLVGGRRTKDLLLEVRRSPRRTLDLRPRTWSFVCFETGFCVWFRRGGAMLPVVRGAWGSS